jgi:putative sigma-54 modulation protein
VVEDDEFKIIKMKKIESKPMSAEEAVLQMNMLGHDFFIFLNTDTQRNGVVYRRKDGNYGLIETE